MILWFTSYCDFFSAMERVAIIMGKDLKGNEMGEGLSEVLKKGKVKIRARFVSPIDGKRPDKLFDTVKEAKQWLANSRYEAEKGIPVLNAKTTLNAWYKQWINHKESNRRYNTVRNYKSRYEINIAPVIGKMPITEIKPIHCQKVLDLMVEDGYRTSTIVQTLIVMQSIFLAAYDNDVIRKNPVTKSGVIIPEGEKKKEIDFFTEEEVRLFLQVAKDYQYYELFALLIFTGLRISEAIGLTWDNVNLEEKTLSVTQTLEYRYQRRIEVERGIDTKSRADGWAWGKPKTKNSARTIRLSNAAVQILESIKDRPYLRDDTPDEFRNLVFLCKRTGLPVRNNTYDNALRKRIDVMTDELNRTRISEGLEPIKPHYLSAHDLRHTYATLYLNSSKSQNYAIAYKALSQSLGHSSIKITLDLYSHLTEESIDELMGDFDAFTSDMIKSVS